MQYRKNCAKPVAFTSIDSCRSHHVDECGRNQQRASTHHRCVDSTWIDRTCIDCRNDNSTCVDSTCIDSTCVDSTCIDSEGLGPHDLRS